MGFLIDGSGSIEKSGRGNFRRCLHFVKRIIASFAVSRSYTRVGVALFSSRTWLIFNFKRYSTKRQVFQAIDRIRYPAQGTRIGKALRFVNYRLFRGSRRRKVTVLCKSKANEFRQLLCFVLAKFRRNLVEISESFASPQNESRRNFVEFSRLISTSRYQAPIVRKPINVYPGLNVNKDFNLSCIKEKCSVEFEITESQK